MENYEENMEEMFDEMEDDEDLLNFFRECLPKTTILDMEEFKKINVAFRILNMVVDKEMLDGKVTYSLIPELLSGAVTYEGSDFIVGSMTLFRTLISISSNMEAYPLTNGNIRISFTFSNIFHSLD